MTREFQEALARGKTAPTVTDDPWTAGLESQVPTGPQYSRVTWSVTRTKRDTPSRGCRSRVTRKRGSHLFSLRAHPTERTW